MKFIKNGEKRRTRQEWLPTTPNTSKVDKNGWRRCRHGRKGSNAVAAARIGGVGFPVAAPHATRQNG